jgi:hypothetical protein
MDDLFQRTGEKLVLDSREPGRNFALVVPSEPPATFHADGIAGVGIAGSLGQIDFFLIEDRVQDNDAALGLRERRVVRLRVAIPAPQLVEGLVNLLEMVQPQADNLRAATQQQDNLMAAQMDRLKAIKFS